MILANIYREILLNDLMNLNEIFSNKKQGFHSLSLEDTFLEK